MTAPDYQAGEDINLDPWLVTGSPIQTFTPELTAATTNPTLGTGAVREGWWTQANRIVAFWARIRFGTSGVNAGSGSYRVSTPTTISSGVAVSGTIGGGITVGRGNSRNNNSVTATSRTFTLMATTTNGSPSGTGTLMLGFFDGTGTQASNNQPFVWEAEDSIVYSGIYPID